MPVICHAPNCTRKTSRFGHYCTTHKTALRRHGNALQKGVTKVDLRPYQRLVQARINKNPQSTAWSACEARWQAVVEHATSVLKRSASGSPSRRSEHMAAVQVVRVADNVEAAIVVKTVLATYLMLDHEPRRFLSDDAFRRQLTRRVLRLTEVNAGEWFNETTGRMQRAYWELPPDAADIIAAWLSEALGPAGLHLAKLEREDAERRQRGKAEFGAALAGLS